MLAATPPSLPVNIRTSRSYHICSSQWSPESSNYLLTKLSIDNLTHLKNCCGVPIMCKKTVIILDPISQGVRERVSFLKSTLSSLRLLQLKNKIHSNAFWQEAQISKHALGDETQLQRTTGRVNTCPASSRCQSQVPIMQWTREYRKGKAEDKFTSSLPTGTLQNSQQCSSCWMYQ